MDKERQKSFPHIARYACEIGPTFLTAASVERVFSILSRIQEIHTNRLNWATIKELLFLLYNMDFFQDMKFV